MNLNFYLAILNFSAITGWIGVLFLVFFLSPYNQIFQNLSIFFCIFFLAILSSYSLLEFRIRAKFFKLSSPTSHLKDATRHGFLVGLVLCILLFLQYLRVLSWWDAGLLILIGLTLELYLKSK